ncbi:MAG: T9SS type A sorting domain-containing protein [Bacteroidales bacterium]|jgi:hypothetical protein
MKKLITILVIMLIGTSAYSQYLVDGLKWNNSQGVSWYGWSVYTNFTYKVDGDTIINNNTYKIIKSNSPDLNSNWEAAFYLREDNQRWVLKDTNINDEILLYDFSLNVGDIFYQYDFYKSSYSLPRNITAVDTITLENGEFRKKITIENDWDEWIDGIGSIKYILDMPIANIMDGPIFLCASNENDLLYVANEDLNCYDDRLGLNDIEYEAQTTIYPNPASNSLNVISQDKINSIEIYNPLGQKVYQTKVNNKTKNIDISLFPKGIYIIGVNTDKGYIKKKLIVE